MTNKYLKETSWYFNHYKTEKPTYFSVGYGLDYNKRLLSCFAAMVAGGDDPCKIVIVDQNEKGVSTTFCAIRNVLSTFVPPSDMTIAVDTNHYMELSNGSKIMGTTNPRGIAADIIVVLNADDQDISSIVLPYVCLDLDTIIAVGINDFNYESKAGEQMFSDDRFINYDLGYTT